MDPVRLGDHYFSKASITGLCNASREKRMSYFWHPITHNVEVPIDSRFRVDLQFSNRVDKAQKLSNKMNFRWVKKVICANAMVENNRTVIGQESREEPQTNVPQNTESIGEDVVNEMITNEENDLSGGQSNNDNMNESKKDVLIGV